MIKPENFPKYISSLLYYLFPFLFFSLYFLAFADQIFLSQEKSILFQASFGYFLEIFHQPGKLLIYLAEFLTSLYYYPLLGAMLVAVIICLVMFETRAILRFLTGKEAMMIPFLLGTLLFLLQTNYQYLLFNSLGLLLQTALFYFTIRFLNKWFPVIIVPVWYFVTGSFSWIYFLMIIFWFITENRKGDWIRTATLGLVCLAVLYISKEFLFFQPVETLAIYPFSSENTGSLIILFLSAASVIAFLPLIARIKIRFPFSNKKSETVWKYAGFLTFAAALGMVAVLCNDKKTNQYYHVEKLYYDGKMDEIIAYNMKNPSNNILTNYLNNIALSERGKLNDLFFHFRQSPDGQTLFLKWEILGEILRNGGYFYYTTGMINEAQRWAFEYMVMKGPTPEGLKMLIKTELINGNYKVASKYINLLKKSLFYSGYAKNYERMLYNETAVNSDPELGSKRREKIKTDFFTITDNPIANIERILATDSLNRKLFEYKMAYLLLKKDYQLIVKELPHLVILKYKKIPVHLEEAAVAYRVFSKQGPLPDLGNLAVSRQTDVRFNSFLTSLKLYNNDTRRAEPDLRKHFGNTFWYYTFYR
jgi:hypothetical protein